MKATVKGEKQVELSRIVVMAGVRYWEDSWIDGVVAPENGEGFPCKNGEMWNPIIDVDTGEITNYDFDKPVSTHFKVCDCCSYKITDNLGEIVFSAENEYVPDFLCPEGSGYGDYIIMEISASGIIQNWNKNKILDVFNDED